MNTLNLIHRYLSSPEVPMYSHIFYIAKEWKTTRIKITTSNLTQQMTSPPCNYIWLDQTLLAVTANKLFVTQPAWSRSRTLIECVLHYQYTIIWNTSMLPYFLASCLDTPTTKNSMTAVNFPKQVERLTLGLPFYILCIMSLLIYGEIYVILKILKNVPGIILGAFPPSSDKKTVTILITGWKKGKGIHFTYGTPFHTGPFISFSLKEPPIGLMNGQHLWVPVGILQKKIIAPEHRSKPKLKVVFQPSIFFRCSYC